MQVGSCDLGWYNEDRTDRISRLCQGDLVKGNLCGEQGDDGSASFGELIPSVAHQKRAEFWGCAHLRIWSASVAVGRAPTKRVD